MKAQITEAIVTRFRKQLGMQVLIFQTNRRYSSSAKGMTDYFITGKGYLIFLELKIGKDKAREEQEKLMENLITCSLTNERVYASFITEQNYLTIIEKLTNLLFNIKEK